MRTACPNCGSPQNFPVRQEAVDEERTKSFIRCTLCRWEDIISVVPNREVEIRRRLAKTGAEFRRGKPVRWLLERQSRRLREGAIKDAPKRQRPPK